MSLVSIVDSFNQVSLHDPTSDILKVYEHIPEINEIDPRGYKMCRPLFSHSGLNEKLGLKEVEINEYDWKSNFLYITTLHHNNPLAAKHINIIPDRILNNIKQSKCKLILDNSLEGDRVFDFYTNLYKSIDSLYLPAKQIFYVTNSLVAEKEHDRWIKENQRNSNFINVISFMYNVMDVQRLKGLKHLPKTVNIDEEIEYKEKNIDKVKHFLKVNRTGRPERNIFMLHLNKHQLLNKFLISFPDYPEYKFTDYTQKLFPGLVKPKNINSLIEKCPFDIDESDSDNHGPPGRGKGKFDADLPFDPLHYRNSFISTIMCAFPFVENACHLHSSTFNPIYCGHPIIEFGPHNHLKILKEQGFKTFDKYWDESYDTYEEGWIRLQKILKLVDTLSKLPKKDILKMYIDMKDTLQHNSDLVQNYNVKKHLVDRILKI